MLDPRGDDPPENKERTKGDVSFSVSFWGITLSTFLILLSMLKPTVFDYFSYKLYDEWLLLNAHGRPSEQILIVDIDEASLSAHGQWPWPRYKIAEILDRLEAYGARAVTLDMMFSERDRTSLNVIKEDLKRDLDQEIRFEATDIYFDNDRLLADSVFRTSAVLGYQFLFGSRADASDCLLHPLKIDPLGASDVSGSSRIAWVASGVACNLDLFADATPYLGFLNASPDRDGMLRKVPLIIEYEGQFYPSLALATVMKVLQIDQVQLHRNADQYVLLLEKRAIPLNAFGAVLVNYRGRAQTFNYASAADLLGGRVPEDRIKDKIVFVGTSAAGFKEFRSTPVEPLLPGVEIHATVVDNILKGDNLSRPAYMRGAEVVIAFLAGLMYVLSFARAGAVKGLVIGLAGAAGLIGMSLWLFADWGIYFSPILPVMVVFFDFAFLNMLKFWREEGRSKRRNSDLVQAQAAIIESMASLTETRDPETGRHIKRTQEYVRLLANALRKKPLYSPLLSAETVDLLYKSAPLHDIGKVGVSDRILFKPGKLTTEEYEEMKKHTTIGRDVIAGTQNKLGNKAFLRFAREIAYTHHEKWDGSGYPRGLKAEEIPLSGRLMAVADMYEALTTRRVYKPAHSHEEALRIMCTVEKHSFDPNVLEAFLEVEDDFRMLAEKYLDPEEKN